MMDNPPSISARELHEICLSAQASTAASRRRFIDALRALYESRLYFQLGFPNIYAYSEATFRYRHSQTHEFIKVSRSLLSLPRIAAAFDGGALSFSLTARLSEVATAETEGEWLTFLEGRRVRAVLAELKEAKRKGRAKPRKDVFGLPGLPVTVTFELSPEEHALLEKGIAKIQHELATARDGEKLEPKEALLAMVRRVLEAGPDPKGEAGVSPFTVVVHKCPSCSRGAVDSGEGRVELEPRALAQIEREAEVVVLEETASGAREPLPAGERDRPNDPALRKAVCRREGGRCANPFCNRHVGDDGQAHHIEARALGGATALWNETYLCCVCHALHHAGHLAIEGDPVLGMVFRPAVAVLPGDASA